MGVESDEQIASRKRRERAVKAAWRAWHKSKLERKVIATLPSANPTPKPIIVTRRGNPIDKTAWKYLESTNRDPR